MRKRRKTNQAGVMIEMLVVVTIIALVAGLVGMRMWKQADKAKVRPRAPNHYADGGAGHIQDGYWAVPHHRAGPAVLRTAPPGISNSQGPYLERELPNDPWGNAYVYHYPSEQGDEPEIISYRADGQPGGEGFNADIVSWKSQ